MRSPEKIQTFEVDEDFKLIHAVQDRLNQLVQQMAAVEQMNQQVGALLPRLSDTDLIIYKNRWLMFGEENAQRWLITKYGQH